MPKDKFLLSPTLIQAFKASSYVAMELDLNMSLSEQLAVAKQTMLPEGKTLRDLTTDIEYQRIASFCKDSCGINKKKFNRYSKLKPFFLSSLMLQGQLKSTESYEIEFGKMAEEDKKTTMGLESIQVQMDILNSVSLSEQVQMLLDGIEKPHGYFEMLGAYLSEDLEALYASIISESEGYPNFIERFINQRNQNWIPIISTQIEFAPTFIAVGAGHLSGEEGVISLLRNAGYSIKPVIQKF